MMAITTNSSISVKPLRLCVDTTRYLLLVRIVPSLVTIRNMIA